MPDSSHAAAIAPTVDQVISLLSFLACRSLMYLPLKTGCASTQTWRSRSLIAQLVLTCDDADEAAAQLQSALARACPHVPPLMDPLVVAGPFGGGKRGAIARLGKLLQGVLAVAPVVTTKERPAGGSKCGERGCEPLGLQWTSEPRVLGCWAGIHASPSRRTHSTCVSKLSTTTIYRHGGR